MPDKLKRDWKGYVVGTNRGSLLMKIQQNQNTLKSITLLNDEALGPALLYLHGNIEGVKVEMQLSNFLSIGAIKPLSGKLVLNFNTELYLIL